MRRALARLLGLFLTLVLASVASIAAFSVLGGALKGRAASDVELPLYVNLTPRNVHDLARSAVRRIVENRDARSAELELVRLGGAALPHVLSELDTLSPSARGRVAVALGPVALRMGVSNDEDLSKPELAVAFWARFWQDRAFDFRPQVARRLVTRLAEKSYALRHEDIVHLDTYSVPDLIRALGRVRNREDVLRAERLTSVLAHVTERGPVVQREMPVAEAARRVREWRHFFADEGADFTTLDGPSRLVAMFVQTRYGRWVGSLLGVVRSAERSQGLFGIPVYATLASGGRLLAVLCMALAAGTLWARQELASRPGVRLLYRGAAAVLTAVPISYALGTFGAPETTAARQLAACVLAGLAGAALLSRSGLAELGDASSERIPLQVVAGAMLRNLPSALGWMLTSVFALEIAYDLEGAAVTVLWALRRGELGAPMGLALCGALGAALLVDVARLAIKVDSPLYRAPSLVEVGGTSRRRWALWCAVTLCLLGLSAAGWSRPRGAELGWSEVTEGARSLIAYASLSTLVAFVLGCFFGALAARGPRTFDGLLFRLVELSGAMPAVLWAAAFFQALGSGLLLALALGAMRALDVAWLLRMEMRRRARIDSELGGRSLGRFPLNAYLRQRLRPALSPAGSALALTPAWMLGIGTTGYFCGLPAVPGAPGWHALLGTSSDGHALPSLSAAVLATLVTGISLFVWTAPRRRLGAFRSVPPPAGGATDTPGLHHTPKSES